MRGRSRHWLGSKSLASRPLLASQQVFAVPQPSASPPRKTSQCSRLIPPRNRASAKSCQCWRAQAASRLHNGGQHYSYGQSQEQRLKPISPIPCAVITRTLQMPDGNDKLGPSQPHQKERFLSEDASEAAIHKIKHQPLSHDAVCRRIETLAFRGCLVCNPA